jgi:integrase
VLERPLGDVGGVVRARRPQRLPVVLHVREIKALLRHLEGSHWLAACLMYDSGLRLMEALRLRVKDLDFEHRAIMVCDGKGQKDRVVTLADELIVSLQRHLEGLRLIHTKDLVDGFGEVYLPDALERKYPQAGRQWGWQYVFPAGKRSIDPRSSKERRHHIDESAVQKAVRAAVQGRYPTVAIPCAMRSRRTSWSGGWTSARSRSSLGTRTFEPHRSTRT